MEVESSSSSDEKEKTTTGEEEESSLEEDVSPPNPSSSSLSLSSKEALKCKYALATSQGMISYATLMYENEGGIAPFYSFIPAFWRARYRARPRRHCTSSPTRFTRTGELCLLMVSFLPRCSSLIGFGGGGISPLLFLVGLPFAHDVRVQ